MNLRKVKSENLFFFLPYGIFLIFSILSTSLYYKFFYGTIYTCIFVLVPSWAGCYLYYNMIENLLEI